MKFLKLSFLLLMGLHCSAQTVNNQSPVVDHVNTIIGTAFKGFKEGLEGGGTMPFVNRPYAMTNFLAQTAENKMGIMSYLYENKSVIGFLASHQPTVWMGDYGYVSVMPQIGKLSVLPKDRALNFSHDNEVTRPYYYKVTMDAKNGQTIDAEITAASKSGIFRFTFPKTDTARIILQGINLNPELNDWANDVGARLKSLKGYVSIDAINNEITGYNPDRQSAQLGPELPNFKGYFVVKFDKKFSSYGTWSGSEIHPGQVEQTGTRMGAYFNFAGETQIQVRIATSFISIEQARKNLQQEIPDWNFERVQNATKAVWEKELSRFTAKGMDKDHKAIFYTALYHCMLFPREFSEDGHYYSPFDDKIHEGTSYTDYSLWDTFRALHPLLTIIQPKRVNGMVNSLVQNYQEGGWLPMWPNPTETNIMIGTHADAVIADAYVKGFRGYNVKAAYDAVRKDAFVAPEGDTLKKWGDRDLWTSYEARGGLTYYHKLGYIPADKVKESVSRTIEYSFDDYCVAQMAKGLNKMADYKQLIAWSKYYKNQYNPTTGFMAPKNSAGEWLANTNEGFTEGTNWTYTFGALHDVPGMIAMMGGKDKFNKKLDENFNEGHYRSDNEPGHHYIYMYNYSGQPWKTQALVREHTSQQNYRNAAIGINGNDDCGQTSAWYLFSIMGFYPAVPASGVYALGAPQFPEISIKLEDGKTFTVKAVNLSDANKYVKYVTLNGKRLTSFELKHADVVKGGTLVFYMAATPQKTF
ncbi:GH92 family glycosyl hydrolase [Mucilaginibacter gynuensis]|uniref:GH92 family glycosyl hydrolase n=1 Tax=Mucilaginibacter gynuensis TaxID=1302236 RepID=A0ABP8FM47_9SPHI